MLLIFVWNLPPLVEKERNPKVACVQKKKNPPDLRINKACYGVDID